MLNWSGTARSSYYYHPLTGKRGRKPSTHTLLTDGDVISNDSVVLAIRFVIAEEFMWATGYHNITSDLQSFGFIINHKKVYRLMKEYRLLCGTVIKSNGSKRQFVRWRVQQPEAPMEQLCMDIKYIHIHGARRNALLLTVLDVYTRSIVGQVLWWRIRKRQVIWLLNTILQQHQTKHITLRNDNGSQFIANDVREYLREQEVNQEFTHIATPQENSFIEAYHSLLERQLLQMVEFSDIEQAIDVFKRWKIFYNERRRHGSLQRQTPRQKWEEYESSVESLRQPTAAKPEEKSRPAAKRQAEMAAAVPYSLDFYGGEAIFAENESTYTQKQTNCFEKNVQLNGG